MEQKIISLKEVYYLVILKIIISSHSSYCQSYNDEKINLTNFITRMYLSTPFEGVKIIEGYDNKCFISVVSLEKFKYPNNSTMTRVAQAKAQSQANSFFNGSTIDSNFIVKITEAKIDSTSKTTMETIEAIRENSQGFIKGLELLTNFNVEDEKIMVFIYYQKL